MFSRLERIWRGYGRHRIEGAPKATGLKNDLKFFCGFDIYRAFF